MSCTDWALGDQIGEQAPEGHQSAYNRPPEDAPNDPGVVHRGLVKARWRSHLPDWVHTEQ